MIYFVIGLIFFVIFNIGLSIWFGLDSRKENGLLKNEFIVDILMMWFVAILASAVFFILLWPLSIFLCVITFISWLVAGRPSLEEILD